MALRTSLVRALISVALLAAVVVVAGFAGRSLLFGEVDQPASASLLAPEYSGLNSSSAAARADAAKALRYSGNTAAVPSLMARLDDPDQTVGLYVAQALGELAPKSALPELRDGLRDRNPDVRWRSALALGELHDTDAVAGLTVALRDNDPMVQRMAAEALAKIGGSFAMAGLVAGLDSSQASTVQAAMGGLEAANEAAVPALTNALLNSTQARQRSNAAVVLSYIATPAARQALQLATLDPDPEVQAVLRVALSLPAQ
jgi:HEAT repeat protein